MEHGVARKCLLTPYTYAMHLLKMLAQCQQELVFSDLHGLSLTAFELALVYSAQKCTYRIWLQWRPVVWYKRTDS